MSVTQAAGASVPGLVLGDARQDSAMNDGPSPSVEVEMSDAAITPNDPSVAPSAALVKAETPAPRQSSPGRLTPEHPVKHEPSATSTMLPRPATPPMPIRARTRSTSPVSGPGSVATGPSMDDKPSASAGTSASPPRDGMDGRSGSAGSGGSEVDKAKLLATIEMTKVGGAAVSLCGTCGLTRSSHRRKQTSCSSASRSLASRRSTAGRS